jgi:DNA-binding NtrC family response regulator
MAPSFKLLPGTRVLVASRDRVFTQGLQESLRARGAQVHSWDGARAWSADKPQLERVDVLLIEAHGLGEAEWALVDRVRDRSPLIEIVAISSDPLVESAVQALRSGLYTLLAYPVSDDQLAEVIAEASDRKRRSEERIEALKVRASGNPKGSGICR